MEGFKILQCLDCARNVMWSITGENFPGVYKCDVYPKQIPDFVEDSKDDCPKFKPIVEE
jgi:hypothetical protein